MNQEDAAKVVNDLFEAWATSLLRYAAHLTKSSAVADDVVQEAFLALYRELREGTRIDNSKAWTFAVVRNQIRKNARYQRRSAEDLTTDAALDMLPARPCWPDVESGTVDSSLLDLSVLSVREEEALLLRLESMKYREIADKLGIGTKSVCTLLARALKKLRMVAQGSWPEETNSAPLKGKGSDALQ